MAATVLCRQPPKVEIANAGILCGGRSVMGVSTEIGVSEGRLWLVADERWAFVGIVGIVGNYIPNPWAKCIADILRH